MNSNRFTSIVRGSALVILAAGLLGSAPHLPHEHEVVVHRSATCGCCIKWVEHMRAEGFRVQEVVEPDMGPVRTQHGVPAELTSCHTAVVGGYVIEGHVPAEVIRQMLAERPAIVGLTVPQMPEGPPGMEAMAAPGAAPKQLPYDVLAFDAEGQTRVYARR